jgi:outer membrane murein-binding lipoprotein Lpp
MRIFLKTTAVLLGILLLTGCISSMNDKKGEGSTKMDEVTCKNGVCAEKTDKDAAPIPSYKTDYPDSSKLMHPELH